MNPEKTKTKYPISVLEAKRHLRIDMDWNDDNDYIVDLIKAATEIAENYTGIDIAKTHNILTLYDFYGDKVTLQQGDYIEADSLTCDNCGDASVGIDYVVKNRNTTEVYFTTYLDGDPLIFQYYTGYNDNVPAPIKRAILLKIGELYDVDRQGYVVGSTTKTNAFENILNPYRIVIDDNIVS